MALFFPKHNLITTKMRPQPTEGELHLLNYLSKEFDDCWQVYFQPNIIGKHPDIVLLAQNIGVVVIEVKDWNYDAYEIIPGTDDRFERWHLKTNNIQLDSPMHQVDEYRWVIKKELNLEGTEHQSVIRNIIGMVYFHNFSDDQLIDAKNKSKRSKNYITLFNKNTLFHNKLTTLINKNMDENSKPNYNERMINDIRYLVQPSLNWIDTMFPIEQVLFNEKQQILSISKKENMKFKGVAGSGKTFVIAKRAINAFTRTKKKVLILYFNITMTNYFHDKISAFRENVGWEAFEIIHFHGMVYNKIVYDLGISIYDENGKFIELEFLLPKIEKKISEGCRLGKYFTILIDEAQDFDYKWFEFIKTHLLEKDGEFVICGDEKQNIYNRELESKKIKTNIIGRWNELNESYRLEGKMISICKNFQKHFFGIEDEFATHTTRISLFDPQIFYQSLETDEINIFVIKTVLKLIEDRVSYNDICIISTELSTSYDLSNILSKYDLPNYYTDSTKESKMNFRMNNGKIKLTSINSFKGWESNTIILIIGKKSTKELIYTGLSRAIAKLYIVNSNFDYEDFFNGEINKGLIVNEQIDNDLPF